MSVTRKRAFGPQVCDVLRMADKPKSTSKRMSRLWLAPALVVLVVAAGGVVAMKMRGPSGRTTSLGGEINAAITPELPSSPASWVNGAPVTLASAKGQVLLVEGWHPA